MVYSADHRVKLPLLESFFSPSWQWVLKPPSIVRTLSGSWSLPPPFFPSQTALYLVLFASFPLVHTLASPIHEAKAKEYTRARIIEQLILLKRPFHYFYRSFETFPIFTIRFDNIFPNQTMTPPLTMFRRNSQKRRLSTSSSMYPKRTWIPNIFCAIRLGTFSESVLSHYMW